MEVGEVSLRASQVRPVLEIQVRQDRIPHLRNTQLLAVLSWIRQMTATKIIDDEYSHGLIGITDKCEHCLKPLQFRLRSVIGLDGSTEWHAFQDRHPNTCQCEVNKFVSVPIEPLSN